jgi:multiple sugar transport system substrate-binding protein
MSRRMLLRRGWGAALALPAVGILAACGATASVTTSAATSSAAPTSTAASSAAASTASTGVATPAASTTAVSSTGASTTATSNAAATVATTTTSLPATAQTPTAGQATLRVAHWQTGVSAQLFDKVFSRFQQLNPTIKIAQEVTPFDQFFQRLLVGFAGGTAPDCFHNSGAYFLNFAVKDVMLDMTSMIQAQKIDFKGTWTEDDVMKYQGKWYSLPVFNTDDLFYYNKTLFTQAGLAEPTDDWTWNDLLSAAQKLTTRSTGGKTDVWGVQIPNGVQGGWGSMVFANGGDWMNADKTKTTLDQPGALGALQFVYDLIQKYKVMPTAADEDALSKAGIDDPFSAGKIAIRTAITSAIPTYLKNAKFDWDVAIVPKSPTTGKNGATYVVQPASTSKATKLADQSFKLLAFQMSGEAQTILATDKTKFVIDIDTAKDATTGYSVPPPAHVARAATTMGFAKDLRYVEAWAKYQQTITDELAKAFVGQVSMEQAAKSAGALGDQVLAQPT